MITEGVSMYIPKRFFNRGDTAINQASDLIHTSATQGLMLEHSPQELRRMARRGHLVMLVRDVVEGRVVVAVGGITKQHRPRKFFGIPMSRINVAEFGALATHPDYGGNGYGQEITKIVAERYLSNGFLRRFWQSLDVLLFAMAALGNVPSNRVFARIGVPMDQSLLPEAARDVNYNAYDITGLGRRGVITSQTAT